MVSTQLIILNYPVILSHQCSTTTSLETYPLYLGSWLDNPNEILWLVSERKSETFYLRSDEKIETLSIPVIECFSYVWEKYLSPFKVKEKLNIAKKKKKRRKIFQR